MRSRTTGILFSVALAVAACSSPRSQAPGIAPTDPSAVRLEVENRNFSDATIYAVGEGRRQRVGRVTGKSTQRFAFRWVPERIRILVDFTGGGRVVSNEHLIVPQATDDLLLIIGVTANSLATLTVKRSQ